MSFQVLSAETRLARMVTWFSGIQNRITDFVAGGKTRSKLEAIAVEMEAQDLQFYQALKKGIAVAVYRAFGHELNPAVAASGTVTFAVTSAPSEPISIPANTQVATVATEDEDEKVYTTVNSASITSPATSVSVAVVAAVAGTIGNTGSGTITVIKSSVEGLETVTNAAALSNGIDVETEAARRARFVEYITTLPRATPSGLERGAKTARLLNSDGEITEQVVDTLVGEPYVGQVYVYIYNGGGTTSAELVAEAQRILTGYTDTDGTRVPGYKAAGVLATVLAATENEVDVTAAVTLVSGYASATVLAEVETAIGGYLGALGIGQTFIYHELIERMMAVAGVSDVSVSAPTTNLGASEISAETYGGSGLDDLTAGGTYSGDGRSDYRVEIDGTGTPDTFQWSKDQGVTWEATEVAITGAAQTLDEGVTVTFGATTGHALTDWWTFFGHRGVVHVPGTVTVT